MPTLSKQIVMACTALGLRVEPDFVLNIGDIEIRTVARIPELGYRNGMLIVTSYDAIRKHSKQLVELGYGFSTMSEGSEDSVFDLDSWCEVFCDWSWNGKPEQKPKWF